MDSKKKNIVFIFNPISGSLKLIPVKSLIELNIDTSLFNYEIITTQYAEHAYEIACDCAKRGIDMAIAVGGDGTVNEVGRGLIGSNTALGIIPSGSGNGLARHLGIPMDPFKSTKWLSKSTIQDIDYGIINGHPFFCTCGIGFDAQISMKFAESKSRGPIVYMEKILREVLTYRTDTYHLCIDGVSQNVDAYIVTCANAGQWGNNAYIAPTASLQDGMLDVSVIPHFAAIDAPLMAYQLFNKQLDKSKNVMRYRCKNLIISREKAGVAHYDGEPIILEPEIKIEIVEKGLKVVVPNKHRHI